MRSLTLTIVRRRSCERDDAAHLPTQQPGVRRTISSAALPSTARVIQVRSSSIRAWRSAARHRARARIRPEGMLGTRSRARSGELKAGDVLFIPARTIPRRGTSARERRGVARRIREGKPFVTVGEGGCGDPAGDRARSPTRGRCDREHRVHPNQIGRTPQHLSHQCPERLHRNSVCRGPRRHLFTGATTSAMTSVPTAERGVAAR